MLTGGEPMLQIDEAWSRRCTGKASRSPSRRMARCPSSSGIDWICVSPKAGAPLTPDDAATELKLVFPQQGVDPAAL